ncbi:MAG: hypothetical protein ACFB4J_15360 [Elainellaceae cyanobacterium]
MGAGRDLPSLGPQCAGAGPRQTPGDRPSWRQLAIATYAGELILLKDCPARRNPVNEAAIRSGAYPLARRLFLIVKAEDSADAEAGQAYGNLLLTKQGQPLIREAGFVPLRSF